MSEPEALPISPEQAEAETDPVVLPLLATRDAVLFPHQVVPLSVGRERSLQAVEEAMASKRELLVVAQRDSDDEHPSPEGLYRFGTSASILKMIKLPDGTQTVIVQGERRAEILEIDASERAWTAEVEWLDEIEAPDELQTDALKDSLETGYQSLAEALADPLQRTRRHGSQRRDAGAAG